MALAALIAAGAVAGDGDLPDLTPSGELKIISKPASPAPAPAPSTARPANSAARSRAMLALPGLTTPPARPSIPLEGPRPAIETSAGELSLDAPIEMKPMPDALPNTSDRSNLPLLLDSSTDDLPPPGGSTSRANPPSRKPTTPAQPVQSPPRRPRLFGFLAGPASPPSPRTTTPGRSVVSDDPRDESAADPALKRRIERQARELIGNRARSVEVKLDGKDAVIQVTGAKLFQKRALRKQLEGIPALSGLRSTIEIGD